MWLFALIFITLAPVLLQFAELSRKLRMPVLVTCLSVAALLIFCGSLVPGALGFYEPVTVGIFSCLLNITAVTVLRRKFKIKPVLRTIVLDPSRPLLLEAPSVGVGLIMLFAAMLLYSLFGFLSTVPTQLFDLDAQLNWDVTSYHLPAVVEFMQTGTLWSCLGPFQCYSQGYELIGGLSLLFFHVQWGLVAVNALSFIFFIATVRYVVEQLLRLIEPDCRGPVRLAVFLVVAAALSLMFLDYVVAPGKNDLFEASVVLAGLAFLLDAGMEKRGGRGESRRMVLVALAIVCNGLALAVKPPALFYLPAVMLLVTLPFGSFKAKSVALVATICGVFALGGFFLARNLIVYHSLSSPWLVEQTYRASMVHLWRDLRLYDPLSRAGLYAGAWLATIALARRLLNDRSNSHAPLISGILLFCVGGLVGFAFMPTGVSNDGGVMNWQDRKIIAVYTVAAAVAAIALVSRVQKWQPVNLHPSAQLVFALAVCLSFPALTSWWQCRWPNGLPGYEVVKKLPPTEIYKWVQTRPAPVRIYSAGLRPWGLYGKTFQNHVFYDLHSHILNHDGPERVLAVLRQFHPDLILISVDPHEYTGAAVKPEVVHWLRRQRQFVEVYNDKTVSGFLVRDGWQELLPLYAKTPEIVEMHG